MVYGEKKPKLYLIFHGRFPSEKAASLFAAKSCEAFADQGYEVTLLVPRRLGRVREPFAEYYGIRNNFRVVFLPTFDLFEVPFLKKISFNASLLFFSITSLVYLVFRADKDAVIYSNETFPLLIASFFFPKTVYEMHDFPEKKAGFYAALFRRVGTIVSTNQWKKDRLIEKFSLSPKKVVYEPNAVDLQKFSITDSKHVAQKKLGLPFNKTLIGYVGMLRTMGMDKGIAVAIEALSQLDASSLLVLVGGSADDIEFYKKKARELGVAERVIFRGFVSHYLVPEYLAAFDVLIAPFPKNDHYDFYMSPMKVFEYMAAGRPIVATDLHSIREIVDPDAALLVPPGDSLALANGVRKISLDRDLAQRYADAAYEKIRNHTWGKRAQRIIAFIRESDSRK
jgi:glycosyltransferase involved in cell wall biosynthesis